MSFFKQLLSQWRRSLVFKAIVKISLIGLGVVLVFSIINFYAVKQLESSHAQDHVAQLIPTVESTVRIACYLKDQRLAKEIAKGLMSNLSVAGVRITAYGQVLAEVKNNYVDIDHMQATQFIRKDISSIIDSDAKIGEIIVVPDQGFIQAQASSYSSLVALVLCIAVILSTGLIALIVLQNILAPIKQFAGSLHRLDPQTMQRLVPPVAHQEDELGSLAEDFNNLIDRAAVIQKRERYLAKQVEQNDRKFRVLVENSVIGLFEVNPSGDLLSTNSAFYTIFNIPEDRKEEAHSLNLKKLLPTDANRIAKMIDRVTLEKIQQKQEFEMISRLSKTSSWLQMILEYGENNIIQGLVHDITDSKKKALETQSMLERDALTGAYNRRGMYARLDKVYEAFVADNNLGFTIMLIDLDWFKQVNDTYGHEAGDIVLTIVTRRLESILRDDDIIARLGGDEFLLILPTLKIREWATHLGERIIGSLMSEMNIGDNRLVKIGASVGVATSHAKDTSMDMLLKRADAAMYSAKRAGKCQLYYSEY
jgi:diguanylate cyclase (GGDEF)-like protein